MKQERCISEFDSLVNDRNDFFAELNNYFSTLGEYYLNSQCHCYRYNTPLCYVIYLLTFALSLS